MSKVLTPLNLDVEIPLTLINFDVEVTYESTISMLKQLTLLDFDVE